MSNPPAAYQFEAIGTQWQIDTAVTLPASTQHAIAEIVEAYDLGFSRFRADSVVRQSSSPGLYTLPVAAEDLEPLYRSLYRLTDGAMTPLVGRSLEHLGYDAHYSLRAGRGYQPAPPWDTAIDWHGRSLLVKEPALLDVGAAGKGQLVDLIAQRLDLDGVSGFFIDASGDLLSRHLPAQRIALEHPYDASQAVGVLELADAALCASASNRRTWGDGLHHVLDGATGKPVQTVVATWAVASSTMLADALATALFFADFSTLSAEFSFSAVRIFSDGRAEISPNFEGEMFR